MAMEHEPRDYLGQGLAFPMHANPRGAVALVRGEEDILQSIRVILGTYPGERVMRPEFGCRARELLFAARNASTYGMMEYYVRRALARWEPRIEVMSVEASDDPGNDGALLVSISYEIKATHDVRSIVYPFFLVEEE